VLRNSIFASKTGADGGLELKSEFANTIPYIVKIEVVVMYAVRFSTRYVYWGRYSRMFSIDGAP